MSDDINKTIFGTMPPDTFEKIFFDLNGGTKEDKNRKSREWEKLAEKEIVVPVKLKVERVGSLEYGMAIARVVASRSSDPYLKVGSVAMNKDGYIIATGYNGTAQKYVEKPGFWEDREERRKYILHSEQNLMSLVKQGEAFRVFVTACPCNECMKLLVAHKVREVYYESGGYKISDAPLIASEYGVKLERLD